MPDVIAEIESFMKDAQLRIDSPNWPIGVKGSHWVIYNCIYPIKKGDTRWCLLFVFFRLKIPAKIIQNTRKSSVFLDQNTSHHHCKCAADHGAYAEDG